MKKTYQKPALLRREQLGKVTAAIQSDIEPAAPAAPNGDGPVT